MINFALANASRDIGIGRYLKHRGARLANVVQPQIYEEILHGSSVPAGTWIFASVDVLTPAARPIAGVLHQRVAASGHRVLNDPLHSLRRYELLTALHEAGVNTFRAVRAADFRGGLKFPVFLRDVARHHGDISGLLHSDRRVRQDLLSARLRGYALDDLLVVEFCDTSVDGWFRKYSAFKVGDRVLGRHAQVSRHWMVKSDTGERTDATATLEASYIDENPHVDQLAPLFEMANIQYGRMDYGMLGDRIQVWEINTTPTLGRAAAGPDAVGADPARLRYRAQIEASVSRFHERLCDAFQAIDTPTGETPRIAIDADPSLHHEWRRETARATRRAALQARLTAVAQHRAVVGVRRVVEGTLRRIASG